MTFQKKVRYKNKAYTAYIISQPCCVTGRWLPNDSGMIKSDPHHCKTRGSGGSDLTQVPLLHELHVELDKIGQDTFQKKYNIDFKDVMLQMLQGFIEKN